MRETGSAFQHSSKTSLLAKTLESSALVWQRIELPDADVFLTQFCTYTGSERWFARLHAEIPWQQHQLHIFGRNQRAPRLSCWIGDAEAVYTYSGARFEPLPWTSALTELRELLFGYCGERFNSVLCNLYRNGQDGMGWHSDDEPELGPEPLIVSLSFGAGRRFRLRHKRDPHKRLELDLAPGSMLLMAGTTQQYYRHDLPKTARPVGPRINLTFRRLNRCDPCI